MSKTLNELASEKCPNCKEVGTAFEPPQGKTCTECYKLWIKPRPYWLYLIGVLVLFWGYLFVANLVFG